MLFIDHTYMFRSSSATILRVYSIKEYNKSCMCVKSVPIQPPCDALTDQYNRKFYDIQIQSFNNFIMITSRILEFYNIL